MKTVVLSVGGSVLVPGEDDAAYIDRLARLLIDLLPTHKTFVVTGGGRPARYYIETGRSLGLAERDLDRLGIDVTRLNARLLIGALGRHAYPFPVKTNEEAKAASEGYPIVVMGGTFAGQTTDAVAADLARAVRADLLVNATAVDGVYTADPAKDPKATRLERLRYDDLLELVRGTHVRAGPTHVFDPRAARLVADHRIPVYVVHGRDLPNLRAALEGKPFQGTRIDGSRG